MLATEQTDEGTVTRVKTGDANSSRTILISHFLTFLSGFIFLCLLCMCVCVKARSQHWVFSLNGSIGFLSFFLWRQGPTP